MGWTLKISWSNTAIKCFCWLLWTYRDLLLVWASNTSVYPTSITMREPRVRTALYSRLHVMLSASWLVGRQGWCHNLQLADKPPTAGLGQYRYEETWPSFPSTTWHEAQCLSHKFTYTYLTEWMPVQTWIHAFPGKVPGLRENWRTETKAT